MNDHNEDAKLLGSLSSRHRSPIFSKKEIKVLVSLIEKYKNIIQNKSLSTASCHAKELAWKKIAKLYNSNGFKHKRNANSLKAKWDNLKRDVRRLSKNLMEVHDEDVDEVTGQIVSLINESENTHDVLLPEDFNEDIKDTTEIKESNGETDNFWDENEEKDMSNTTDKNEVKQRMINRSNNFSPQECSILLKCVRSEKKFVLTTENTVKAIKLKNRAWARVTQCFNKISPQKRSTKMLRTKFYNMKKRTKTNHLFSNESSSKYSPLKLEDGDRGDRSQKIKSEPGYGFDDDTDIDKDDDSDHNDDKNDSFNMLHSNGDSNHVNIAPDPLSMVLNNGDSGLDSINFDMCSENKEIAKKKMELLQYQLETAKLERKRVEAAMLADAEANSSRAAETALRLRAARLDAVAAAARLPPAHPALLYMPEEARAQQYLGQYQTSV